MGHSKVAHIDDHLGVSLLEQLPADWSSTVQTFQAQVRAGLGAPPTGKLVPVDVWETWEQAATSAFRNWGEELESRSMANLRGDDIQTAVLRARHAQWRSRNLAMAARLREATTTIPGGRLVVLVGSSHERPLRAALTHDQHDLNLVDITDVRRQFESATTN